TAAPFPPCRRIEAVALGCRFRRQPSELLQLLHRQSGHALVLACLDRALANPLKAGASARLCLHARERVGCRAVVLRQGRARACPLRRSAVDFSFPARLYPPAPTLRTHAKGECQRRGTRRRQRPARVGTSKPEFSAAPTSSTVAKRRQR